MNITSINETSILEDSRIFNGRAFGILYEDELQIMSSNSQCSFQICKAQEQQNKLEVDWFRSRYGENGRRMDCYYNPYNISQVLVDKKYRTVHIFHAVFWPCTVGKYFNSFQVDVDSFYFYFLVIIAAVSWYVAKRCKEDIEDITGINMSHVENKLDALPQAPTINRFGHLDYNRDGWPVWPSLVDGMTKAPKK